MNNHQSISRLCSHCSADISHKRPQALFCSDACRKDHNRASKIVTVIKKCGHSACDNTFERSNGRDYCSEKCSQRAKNKRRDQRSRKRQDVIAATIYSIAKTGQEAFDFMLAYIDSDDIDDRRALSNASMVLPRRKSRSRIKAEGKTRGENRVINKIIQRMIEEYNSKFFLNGDAKNRTAPEIANAFCWALFGVGIMQYRAHKDHWTLPINLDFVDEVMRHGLPDWIIFHDPNSDRWAKSKARLDLERKAFPDALLRSHKSFVPAAIAEFEDRKANGTYKPRKKKAA